MNRKDNYQLYDNKKFKDIRHLLEHTCSLTEKPAFKYRYQKEIKEISYKDFLSEVEALGSAIADLGLDMGHAAIIGENSYRWINVYLSLLVTRATAVPIDRELPEEEMLNVLNASDSEIIFYSAEFEDFVRKNESLLPKVKKFIFFEPWSEIKEEELCPEEKFITLSALFTYGLTCGKEAYESISVGKDDVKLLVYTSGTTGVAKGVMLTTENITSMIYGGLSLAHLDGTCLSVLPYHHTYASVVDILGGLNDHVTICINEGIRFVPMNLKEYKPDYMFLVPRYLEVFYDRIWAEAAKSGKDKLLKKMIPISNALLKAGIDIRKKVFKSVHAAFGGNVKMLLSGGALLRADLGDFFEAVGIPIVIGYGITECSPLVSANRNEFYDVRSVGLPLPGVEVKIDDPSEEGIGEILVKGPIVMKGYYKNEEATNAAMDGEWFKTGDYGKINEKGQIFITGRKKNVIVLSNGKNVYPEEIENYILTSPVIEEAIVYSLENEKGDETALCAEVFLKKDEVEKLGLDSSEKKINHVTEAVREKLCSLPSYKQIRKIVIRETEFIKTTTKKIKRNLIDKKH